jgi:hypothetical protein
MPRWLGRSFLTAAFLLVWLFAYRHLVVGNATHPGAAGCIRTDFETLAEVGGCVQSPASRDVGQRLGCLFEVRATGGHPLAALSLVVSSSVWSDAGSWRGRPPLALRLENLLLLGLAALGLRAFLRRLLWPWTGRDQAAAAGTAAGAFLCLHPLAVGGVTVLAARGELLALLFGTFAGAAFLRGRQEREHGLVVSAAVLCILSGLCADLALALPLLLGLAELCCSRRYQPWAKRLRTALTTVVVFAACVAVDACLRAWHAGGVEWPHTLAGLARIASLDDAVRAAAIAIEKLGVAVVPVGAAEARAAALVLAGAVVLLAIHPGLVAARSAPRLWGVLLAAWGGLVLLALLPGADVRVHLGDLSAARLLLPASVVLCAGLGCSATALSGLRRALVPALVGLGLAVLAGANARALASAARVVAALQADLLEARELHGREARLLVIDPPGPVRGFDALGQALPWMLAPIFTGEAWPAGPLAERLPWVRGISAAALPALAREAALDELRTQGLVVLVDPQWLADQVPARPSSVRRRAAVPLPPPSVPSGRLEWFTAAGTSVALDLPALAVATVVARVSEQADRSRPPRLGWRATGWPYRDATLAGEGALTGTWVTRAGELLAVFDVRSSVAWLLGGRIKSMWPDGGWAHAIVGTGIELDLPGFDAAVVPRKESPDWVFERPRALSTPAATGEGTTWHLCLLELSRYAYRELELTTEGAELHAAGATELVTRWLQARGGPVAWTLEQRLGGVTVARALGRRGL